MQRFAMETRKPTVPPDFNLQSRLQLLSHSQHTQQYIVQKRRYNNSPASSSSRCDSRGGAIKLCVCKQCCSRRYIQSPPQFLAQCKNQTHLVGRTLSCHIYQERMAYTNRNASLVLPLFDPRGFRSPTPRRVLYDYE